MRSEEIGAKISTIANKRLHRAGLPLCSPSEQVHSPSGATDPPQHMGGMHPHERPSSRQLHQFLPHLVRLKQGAQALEDLQSMGDVAPVRKRSSPRFHLPDGSAETARWASSTFLLPHPSVLRARARITSHGKGQPSPYGAGFSCTDLGQIRARRLSKTAAIAQLCRGSCD